MLEQVALAAADGASFGVYNSVGRFFLLVAPFVLLSVWVVIKFCRNLSAQSPREQPPVALPEARVVRKRAA